MPSKARGSLGQIEFQPGTIAEVETFACLERALLRNVVESLQGGATPDCSTWHRPAVAVLVGGHAGDPGPWALVAAAAEVLLEADRVAKALKEAPDDRPRPRASLCRGRVPWCLLDTHHRHMESRWYNFEPEPATSSRAGQADPQGRAAIHRGRLGAGEASS